MKPIQPVRSVVVFASPILIAALAIAAEKKAPKKKGAPKNVAAARLPSPVAKRWDLADDKQHRDFPAMALGASGTPWLAFIEHDGKADVHKLSVFASSDHVSQHT